MFKKTAGKVFEFLVPKPKVNKTKLDKAKSETAKSKQKLQGSTAKLKQTQFEITNKLPLTFGKSSKKTMSNTELRKAAEARKKEKKQETKTKHFYAPDTFLNKGGRVGLKRGTGLMKKKSNVEKIKETFSPKNKSTKFGMLSVKAGIDKNPNPTQADRIAGAKMKNRMKAAFGGGADMGKVASDKTKTEVKKYEKRAKDASKFLKNKGRSFGSIMREKYMR